MSRSPRPRRCPPAPGTPSGPPARPRRPRRPYYTSGRARLRQPSPDPAQLQAAAELRQTRWRIHEAEQALAAERALLAQQAPHLPQSANPGWASGNADTATPATDIITAADTAHTVVPSPNAPIDLPNGNGKKSSRLIKSSSSTVRPTLWVRRSGSGPWGIMATSPAIPSTASSTRCRSSSRPRSLIGSPSCSSVNMAWLTPPLPPIPN